MSDPVSVTHYSDGGVSAGRFLVRHERPSLYRSNPENREIIRTNDGSEDAAGIPFLADANHRNVVGRDIRKRRILRSDIGVGGIRKRPERFRILGVLGK